MRKSTIMVLVSILAMVSGCNQHHEQSEATVLSAPSDAHDLKAWGAVVKQGLASNSPKGAQQPYSFVVPAGNSQEAVNSRRNESEALRMQLEGGTVPGRMIGIGGPDPDKTAETVIDAVTKVTPGRANGVTIVVVGSGKRDAEVKKQAEACGATIQIKAVVAR